MQIKKNRVIIFDGDDTLWKTQELYNNAKEQFEKLMKAEGFNEDIIKILDEIDAQRVDILRFSKSRFLESMLITYAILCGRYKKNWNIEIEKKIRDYSQVVLKFPPELYEDTIKTLKILSKNFTLILFTNGDEHIQKRKIESLGKEFISYFSKIFITEKKNEKEYEKIIKDLVIKRENIWVIGNSVKSDINPAIKIGLRAILIPRKTWRYEEDQLIPNKVLFANSIIEAKNLIFEEEFR